MHNPLHTLRLSVKQFLEAAGDDNRFYAARALNKPFHDVTIEECVAHYIAHTPQIGMTVYGHDVWPAQPPGDMGQMQMFPDLREPTALDPHKAA